ncbi:MAG TPA: ABC-F family ATP-binding cassette domain-containing protein, partial [Candidatus Limnocylindrales bacterium]|nr:ABC-F family ATP-binding cassette domain-containing protein [Candidatus Limnocylindrales bacterium]
MAILRLSAVRREIGTLVILDSVTGAIAHGEKVGLVGANGAGKTTLLRIAAGNEQPDSGHVTRRKDLAVGLLAQEANLDPAFALAADLRSAVRSGAGPLEQIERRLAELEHAGAEGVESNEYASLRDSFDARGGYSLDVRVDSTLSGLGFDRADWGRPVSELSGGQQTRAALARLLVAELDLLMLDEPTNHLDVGAIEWLETSLAERDGALLVASHDRAFLDAVVGRVWELRDRRLTAFRGNYAAFLTQREERDARARKDTDTLKDQIEREKELVQRYRSHRKYSKMHEHERRLEALQVQASEVPTKHRSGVLSLGGMLNGGASSAPARSGEVVVGLEGLAAGYDSKPVVRVERLEARRGTRIGLVGPNGSGKTTLMRTIAGDLAPIDGRLVLGQKVQVGYLAQIRRMPMPGTTVLETLTTGSGLDDGPARSYLARFLFRGDDAFKPVANLSGGERSRLELALVGLQAANLLLLDEPTNHLDIPAREALESFLRDAAGTVIVVSHDRRLLDAVCTELWVVEAASAGTPARVARFDGGFAAWRAAQAAGWSVESALNASLPAIDRAPTKAAPPPAAPKKTRRPAVQTLSKDAYRRRRQVVEDDLTRLGLRKTQLELALGDPTIQSNFVELRRVSSELADVDAALAQAEDAWLTLAEQA